jgi:hypothetical protein
MPATAREEAVMAVISHSAVIRCTPEEAFDYLSDHRSELEWNPICEAMEKITDGPVGAGTRFRAKWKGSPLVELELTYFERPRTWSAHNGGPVEIDFTCAFEPVAEGTRMHVDFRTRPHGWFRLVYPIFLVAMRRQEKANMQYIRVALEKRAGAHA